MKNLYFSTFKNALGRSKFDFYVPACIQMYFSKF